MIPVGVDIALESQQKNTVDLFALAKRVAGSTSSLSRMENWIVFFCGIVSCLSPDLSGGLMSCFGGSALAMAGFGAMFGGCGGRAKWLRK